MSDTQAEPQQGSTMCEVCRGDAGKTAERMIDSLVSENERLQAEVKRLTAWTDEDAEAWKKPMSYTAARAENRRLQAELETARQQIAELTRERDSAYRAETSLNKEANTLVDDLADARARLAALIRAITTYRAAAEDAGSPMLPWPALDLALDAATAG